MGGLVYYIEVCQDDSKIGPASSKTTPHVKPSTVYTGMAVENEYLMD
jgi:hypothetical protein